MSKPPVIEESWAFKFPPRLRLVRGCRVVDINGYRLHIRPTAGGLTVRQFGYPFVALHCDDRFEPLSSSPQARRKFSSTITQSPMATKDTGRRDTVWNGLALPCQTSHDYSVQPHRPSQHPSPLERSATFSNELPCLATVNSTKYLHYSSQFYTWIKPRLDAVYARLQYIRMY